MSCKPTNPARRATRDGQAGGPGGTTLSDEVVKTDEEWQQQLDADQYAVCRCAATEPAWSGRFNHHEQAGTYRCVCCSSPLFGSGEKFDSGSGWPSFWAPVSDDAVRTREDTSRSMRRTEVLCRRCDAHLGHVFPDGPAPTHQRYCINSIALDFEPGESVG